MSVPLLPTINACFNAASAVLLVTGFVMIRRGRQSAHMKIMLAALATSGLFLVGYLLHHFTTSMLTRFSQTGPVRTVYLLILVSHSILAAAILPMIVVTLWRAYKGRFDAHRRVARWTFPLWLYVSATGVIVYLMLYIIWPSAAVAAT